MNNITYCGFTPFTYCGLFVTLQWKSALTQEVKCITFIFQTIMHSSVTHLVQGVSWYGGKQISVCWGHCDLNILHFNCIQFI